MGQITYSWQIRPTFVVTYNENTLQNVVNTVVWTYVAQYTPDGETTPTFTTGIKSDTTLPSPDSNNFIPFENLTEQTVLGWITSSVGTTKITEMQKQLSASIAFNVTPTAGVLTAPWV